MLSRLVITFLPRSECLLISWLQSPSAVILEPKKIKSFTVSIVSPSICLEVMGPDLCSDTSTAAPQGKVDFVTLADWVLPALPCPSLSLPFHYDLFSTLLHLLIPLLPEKTTHGPHSRPLHLLTLLPAKLSSLYSSFLSVFYSSVASEMIELANLSKMSTYVLSFIVPSLICFL